MSSDVLNPEFGLFHFRNQSIDNRIVGNPIGLAKAFGFFE